MQLKQFYNIATKVSSRKKFYYFWWSTWLVSTGASTRAERSLKGMAQPPQAALRVFMLKTPSAASDSKADPTMTTPLQWITGYLTD